ncbi:hypothetical protein M9458_053587, partial [Cirrhinus mrigala]
MPAGKQPLQSERDPQEEGVKRKQARKRKHVEGDIGHLQKQMQGMQETLNTLLEAQQWTAEPQDLELPLLKRSCRHPDELSVTASGVFGRDENAGPSDPEDISESEMGDSASETSETTSLDPSDKAVISRAAEPRRQIWLSQANLLDQDCMAVTAAPLVPGEVFGPPAEAALEQSRRTRELTRSVVRAPVNRGLRTSAGNSNWARAESSSQAFVGHRRAAAQGVSTRPSQGARQSFRRSRQAESSSTRPTYCQLPGRLDNLLSYRAAGQEQHKDGLSPLAQIGTDTEQQKELSHSHKGSDIPRLDFEFEYNESIFDSTEAVSVEGVPVRVPQKGACYSDVGSETAWPNGGSQSGGAIRFASHAPITAMAGKVQSKSMNGQRMIPRDQDCLPAVKWWLSTPGLKEGVKLGPQCSRETITTDASQAGWGAVWRGNPVQGKWDAPWIGVHINLLELEAVFRALIHFLPQLQEKQVIIRSDSTSVVSYINHQGGVRSISLHRKAQDLLLWAHARGVSLRAVHLPGEDNVAADLLSRGGPRPGEWRLHPAVVQAIWLRFGKAKVDLFATQETTHCPLWYSMVGPRGPLGVDALANEWPPVLLYAFPPFPLLPAVIAKVRYAKAKVLLVAPDWPQQSWMPDLIALLKGSPWHLPVRRDMLSQARGQISHPNPGKY